jgi:hypothetical protein
MTALQVTMFDYAALDTETRITVQQRTTEIKALMKRAATDNYRDRAKADRCQGAAGAWVFRRLAGV